MQSNIGAPPALRGRPHHRLDMSGLLDDMLGRIVQGRGRAAGEFWRWNVTRVTPRWLSGAEEVVAGVFAQQGHDATRMDDLAGAMRVPRATLYYVLRRAEAPSCRTLQQAGAPVPVLDPTPEPRSSGSRFMTCSGVPGLAGRPLGFLAGFSPGSVWRDGSLGAALSRSALPKVGFRGCPTDRCRQHPVNGENKLALYS